MLEEPHNCVESVRMPYHDFIFRESLAGVIEFIDCHVQNLQIHLVNTEYERSGSGFMNLDLYQGFLFDRRIQKSSELKRIWFGLPNYK